MTSLLEGSLARTIGSAAAFLFLDATLVRDVANASTDPADPVAPTPVTYTCKAIEDQWSVGLMANGLIADGDIQVLILATSFKLNGIAVAGFVPAPLDRITIRNITATIVPADTSGRRAVETDPARATWSCRCNQ